MIRFLDLSFSILGVIIFSPFLFILYIIGIIDTGSPIFIQKRLGQNQKQFKLIKFRTMRIGTADVGTHLSSYNDITKFGHFLRKNKLDELPQLLNVIKGDMSLVGPRPGLPSQKKLLQERQKRTVYSVRPGITGLSQIKNIDMSTPKKLSKYDQLMISNHSLCNYFYYIIKTLSGKGMSDKIKTTSN